MDIISLNYADLNYKVVERIKSYLAMSNNNRLTVGLYKNGKFYVLGNPLEENQLLYDIGSVSKTVTAHLILKLCDEGKLDINCAADEILPLKKGKYPTVYQLLTHTSGYNYLTPIEVTLPHLIANGYSRKNPYEDCTVKTILKCVERRRFFRTKSRYAYSDFDFAILATIAEAVEKKPFSLLFEDFIQSDLGLINTSLEVKSEGRTPLASKGKRILPFWVWKKENPYIASGGIVSNIEDILRYIALEIESDESYITKAHIICEESESRNGTQLMCMGWNTYKRSNQLWHVGGGGTFRTSLIINRKLRIGVAVLGNATGKAGANCHYIAKMFYGDLKNKRIRLK